VNLLLRRFLVIVHTAGKEDGFSRAVSEIGRVDRSAIGIGEKRPDNFERSRKKL
jgi:hypothetical protein